MSRLLEILGRAMTVDTAELIAHWLNEVKPPPNSSGTEQYRQLNKLVKLINEKKIDAAGEQIRLYLFENPS